MKKHLLNFFSKPSLLGKVGSSSGFRRRSDESFMIPFMAVIVGVGSGVYIFQEPLRQASEDVKAEHKKK